MPEPDGWNYHYIATVSSASINGGSPIILKRIIIGTTGAGTILVLEGTTTIATLKSSMPEGSYDFDTVIQAATVRTNNSASLVTVVWRPRTG